MDALFYIAAQFTDAAAGVGAAGIGLSAWLSHPSVDYVVTLPGRYGYRWAFVAEVAITFLLMSVILRVSNTPKLNRYTGLFAGLPVMAYISIEAPISGMSMNPARTLGSALSAANWTSIWIYFTAPPLGMCGRSAPRAYCAPSCITTIFPAPECLQQAGLNCLGYLDARLDAERTTSSATALFETKDFASDRRYP